MRLRALTYNVHKCIGTDRRYDPERVAEVIAHHAPDLVLLQEVAQATPRHGHERQVERLSELLGLRHHAYFVTVKKRGGRGEYGNAILSRFPLTAVEHIDVTVKPKKKRSILHARARVRDPDGMSRSVHVFNLHLGLSGLERRVQLRRFLDCHPFARLHARTPILVGGDFNDFWGRHGRMLAPGGFRSGSGRPIRTFPSRRPIRPLDCLFVRGDVRVAGMHRSRLGLARVASDHLPLIAELDLLSGRRGRTGSR